MATSHYFWAPITASLLVLVACSNASGSTATPPVAVTPAPAPTPTPTPTPTPPPVAGAPSVEREVLPASTNAAININLSAHVVINPNPAVTARGRLFVMLPGTLAVARTYRLILRTGATRGYHAIGLTYPNDSPVEGICASSSDPACAENFRRETINGENVSSLVAVDPANSIVGRLEALLTSLAASFPNEGWGQYLVGGRINWALVTVAGHSQGAGHAAFLAKIQSLDRAVMFSGPTDTGVADGSPAPWLNFINTTPLSRQYAFTHVADTLASIDQITRNWAALGLPTQGALTSVDGTSAPFGNSHQLTTNAAPNPSPTGPSASPTHGAPVVDAVTPLTAQGAPLFEPVWIYLAFP